MSLSLLATRPKQNPAGNGRRIGSPCYRPRQWGAWLLTGLSTWLVACTDHLDFPIPNAEQQRVQAAVDSVRLALSNDLSFPVPSMSVLIQTPTQKLFVCSAAQGVTPVTENTFFRFASNTKNFTATSILNMHEDGWLDYKARITDLIPGTNAPYVPATPDWNIPNKNRITIEQLLQHSAGVYDVDNDPVPGLNGETYVNYVQSRDSSHRFTTEELVKPLIDYGLSYFSPGTGFHYSNTGYAILSRIIERVYSVKSGSAKTYADYIYDYLTGPGARVPLPVRFPYQPDDVNLPQPSVASLIRQPSGALNRFGRVNMSAHVGEGNGYGTMAALNTYVRSLMRGENVLQPETVRLMQTDMKVVDSTSNYGLGCVQFRNLGYGHNGAIAGYLSVMAYDPATQVSVVTLLPYWDFTQDEPDPTVMKGLKSFIRCFLAAHEVGYAAKGALGYPIQR